MSIETLLEAAKFLELQALQQQKAREENEFRERLRQEQEAEQRKRAEAVAVTAVRVNNNNNHHHNHPHKAQHQPQHQSLGLQQPKQLRPLQNHITWVEETSGAERRLAPVPVQPSPPSMPIAVIPIPVVPATTPTNAFPPAPNTARSPTINHHQSSPRKDSHSPSDQLGHPQNNLLIAPESKSHSRPELQPSSLVQLQTATTRQQQPPAPPQQQQPQPSHVFQPYPGTIVTSSQQAVSQPSTPQARTSPGPRLSPTNDSRLIDGKKNRPGGAGTREVHNKLEKNRRAHLKECFETLKKNIPNVDEKKASNLSVLRSALRYIQTLKRKEKEFEHEMERLAREKIATQGRLAELKNELTQWMDVLEVDRLLRQTMQPEDDQASTSTASEGEDNMDEDMEDLSSSSPPPKEPEALPPEPKKASPVPTTSAPTAVLLNNHHHLPHLHTATIQQKLAPQLALSPAHVSPVQVQAHTPALAPATALPSPVATAALSPVASSPLQAQALMAPQALLAAHAHIVAAPSANGGAVTINGNGLASVMQPTVIAHAAPATHASVIQATVNHIIHPAGKQQPHSPQTTSATALQQQAAHQQQPGPHGHPQHATLAHLAPTPTATQPISHITVHPVAHLNQHHLSSIYPQPVATVTQPTVVSHIAHTLTHAQMNGAPPTQVGKPTLGAQVVAHHPQLVGPTVLNPVTMVTMPSFPVSTLKLASGGQ